MSHPKNYFQWKEIRRNNKKILSVLLSLKSFIIVDSVLFQNFCDVINVRILNKVLFDYNSFGLDKTSHSNITLKTVLE